MVFFVKNWKIWVCFLGGILGVDKVFGDILNSKQSTLEEKNVHICKWPNGSIQGFFQKMEILKLILFWKNKYRESVWWFSIKLTSDSRREKCRFVSGQSWNFPKGSTYTFCKNWNILNLFPL